VKKKLLVLSMAITLDEGLVISFGDAATGHPYLFFLVATLTLLVLSFQFWAFNRLRRA